MTNVFKYLNLIKRKKALLDYVFKQTFKEEITYNITSRNLGNELEIYLASVDFYVEFPAKWNVNLNKEGISLIADNKKDVPEVIEFFCDYAGNILEYKTGL